MNGEHPAAGGLRRRRAAALSNVEGFGDQVVRDPRGGRTSAGELVARGFGLHGRIDAEQRGGTRRHDRISRGRRALTRVLPVLDGLVLFWFIAGVLNADLRRVDVTTVVAAVLAVLASVAVAAWNTWVGEHLQDFTDRDRHLVPGALDGVAVLMVGATALVWGLLGAMMTLRVSEEIYQSTGQRGVTAWVVALALAAALVLLNAYVLHLALCDGSPLTRELHAIGRVLRGPLRRRERHRRRAVALKHRLSEQNEAVRHVQGLDPRPELLPGRRPEQDPT